jgi:hypothetical protein
MAQTNGKLSEKKDDTRAEGLTYLLMASKYRQEGALVH